MGAYAVEPFFKVDGVIKEAQNFEFPVIQTEQCTDGHVVDSRFLRPVERVQAPSVIRLRPSRMHPAVCFMVIGLLKHLVRAYADLLQRLVLFHGQGRGIDVYPPYLGIALFYVVNISYNLGNVSDTGRRVLSGNKDKPLVACVDKRLCFFSHLLDRQRASYFRRVFTPETAV
jgi:hypothetical protein